MPVWLVKFLTPVVNYVMAYLGRIVAGILATLLTALAASPPDASSGAMWVPYPHDGNMNYLFKQFWRFFWFQVLASIAFAVFFGVGIDLFLYYFVRRGYLRHRLGEVQAISRTVLAALFFVVAIYYVLYFFNDLVLADNFNSSTALSEPERWWALKAMVLAYTICAVLGWFVFGAVIYTFAPNGVRITAAPLGMKRIFRFFAQLS